MIRAPDSGKTNIMLNLINHQNDNDDNVIDRKYLYAKNPYEAKYQLSINKGEKVILDHFNDSETFIEEYSNDMQYFYKNIEKKNPQKVWRVLIVFDDSNKKLRPVVTELLIRGRKLNISLVFIRQLYFKVPKDVRLNCTHYSILKISSKIKV